MGQQVPQVPCLGKSLWHTMAGTPGRPNGYLMDEHISLLLALGRASSRLPARAPEQGELLKGIQECHALLGGWDCRVLAGVGLASLFPAAASSLAWPQSLTWPLVVDGP